MINLIYRYKLKESEGSTSGLAGRISILVGRISNPTGRISALVGRISTATGRISALVGSISTLAGRISGSEGRISTAVGRISKPEFEILHQNSEFYVRILVKSSKFIKNQHFSKNGPSNFPLFHYSKFNKY